MAEFLYDCVTVTKTFTRTCVPFTALSFPDLAVSRSAGTFGAKSVESDRFLGRMMLDANRMTGYPARMTTDIRHLRPLRRRFSV
jgi:hypothetical protein